MTRTPMAIMAHPSAELYGSDRMFAESARALTKRGWRVVAVLPQHGPLVAHLKASGAQVTFCRTPVLSKAALRPVGLALLLWDALRSLAPMLKVLRAHRPDMVYVSTVTIPLWLVLARINRHKVVAHVHEAENYVAAPIRAALATPLLAAHVVVVNSEVTGSTVTQVMPRLARKIRRVDNGVAGPERQMTPVAKPDQALRLVLVGRLSPRKGSDVAVEAVQLLKRTGHMVTLDLFGSVFPGYEWFEERLRERIDAADLREDVRLCGFVHDVWRAYEGAGIALVPSTRVESFGNAAVEAQLAGVPVIVTAVPGLPETVGYGEYGVVVRSEDPDAIADAVRRMLKDWDATRATAQAAQHRARVRFAPARYRHEIAEVVAELAP